ncbi:MAG TPA: hypothetical protein VFJ93_09555 [Gaiellaceae bacterium]|nr:hypothetical protein [Gaiellaceae bacterium]
MRRARKTPLAAVVQGLCAGVIGNAIFTAYQELTGANEQKEPPKDWSETPEPAQVGKRIAEGVFQKDVPLEKAGLVTNVVHWLYGTSWGAVYGVIEESVRKPIVSGVALTGTVMASDYTLLPAMNLYEPPWRYPAKTLARDFATHLVHGLAIAGAYKALDVALDGRR